MTRCFARAALLFVLVSAVTSAGRSDFIGNDITPPDVKILSPARGEYVSDPAVTVAGTATDAQSGVVTLSVNGQPVRVGVDGSFQATLRLVSGINIVTARATDAAGNTGTTAVGYMFAPTYASPNDPIPLAVGNRLNESTLNAVAPVVAQQITSSRQIQHRLGAGPLFRGDVSVLGVCVASAIVTVQSVTFDPIQIQLDSLPGGINALVHVPNLRIQAKARDECGIPYSVTGEISAQQSTAVLIAELRIDEEGEYAAKTIDIRVALNGFRFDLAVPAEISQRVQADVEREVGERLAKALRTEVPKKLRRTLSSFSQPITRTSADRSVTLALRPVSLGTDDLGFTVAFDGSVMGSKDPSTPTVPGSVVLRPPSQTIPTYASTPGFYVSLNENALNRALFASWQAGFFNLRIDQAFLTRFGVSLPFQLDGQLIAAFFPQLAGMVTPGGQPIPIALQIDPRLQPILQVSGAPVFTLDLGELHVSVLIDRGNRFESLFTAVTHVRTGVDPVIVQNGFAFRAAVESAVGADLINPPPIELSAVQIERFLQFIVPPAIQVAAAAIQPFPLPSPQGLTLTNSRIFPDGQQSEFVTVSGDVR